MLFINQVLDYGNSWNRLVEDFPEQLADIERSIRSLGEGQWKIGVDRTEYVYWAREAEDFWNKFLKSNHWRMLIRRSDSGFLSRPNLRSLGYIKNEVSARMIRQREVLNSWLYTLAPVAVRSGVISLPIAVTLLEDAQAEYFERNSAINGQIFETVRENLLALSPLSHSSPFLILGLGVIDKPPEIIQLEKEDGITFRQVVVNRSIEFPPQYHQAGLGVLTYFGTVLREKYPTQNVKVRIEQSGLKVRLIVESENGDREVIERALQEYEMVVRGDKPPETLLSSATAIIELKNELRIAQVRIESQRDIITLQTGEITSLRQLIGHSLSKPSPAIEVTVSPILNIKTEVSQLVDARVALPEVTDDVRELITLQVDPDVEAQLLDLSEALDATAAKENPEDIRKSSGFGKLKKFLEDASTAGTKVNTAITKIDEAVSLVQKIGRKYNAIAEWCAAPTIPRILLGEDRQ